MRLNSFLSLLVLGAVLAGCAGLPRIKIEAPERPAPVPTSRWYLDPAVEMSRYRTFGFFQVTASRYMDPLQKNKQISKKQPAINYNDELIWRILQDQLQAKGYNQIAPEGADLLVIYYGGPRPIAPMPELSVQPSAFDQYFSQYEARKGVFFIDIIDAKEHKLLYRGWDTVTFGGKTPTPEAVIRSVQELISFFPNRI